MIRIRKSVSPIRARKFASPVCVRIRKSSSSFINHLFIFMFVFKIIVLYVGCPIFLCRRIHQIGNFVENDLIVDDVVGADKEVVIMEVADLVMVVVLDVRVEEVVKD